MGRQPSLWEEGDRDEQAASDPRLTALWVVLWVGWCFEISSSSKRTLAAVIAVKQSELHYNHISPTAVVLVRWRGTESRRLIPVSSQQWNGTYFSWSASKQMLCRVYRVNCTTPCGVSVEVAGLWIQLVSCWQGQPSLPYPRE